MIAFDNMKYAVIDLEAKDESETTKLFDIRTGIGGYMPRYITDSIKRKASSVNSAQVAQTGRPETCQRFMVSFGSWRVMM